MLKFFIFLQQQRKPLFINQKRIFSFRQNSSESNKMQNPLDVVRTEKVELVGSVRYDPKQEIYYDSLKVGSTLIGMLRGKEQRRQKKMEDQFKCIIHFPKKRATGNEIEIRITSNLSANYVQQCREEMERATANARKQAIPTHFISIPLFDAKLREQYTALVERICTDPELEDECKQRKLFMPPSKLHLTLGVLKLFTNDEVEAAKQFLNRFLKSEEATQIFSSSPSILLEFPSLEHFTDKSPDKIAVIFAKTKSERLQKLANAIDDALSNAGLVEPRKMDDVVLHMTVLNTKYLWQKRRTFLNAKTLLEKFGQLEFDPVHVQELHLCEMKGTDDEINGYKSVHVIKFLATIK